MPTVVNGFIGLLCINLLHRSSNINIWKPWFYRLQSERRQPPFNSDTTGQDPFGDRVVGSNEMTPVLIFNRNKIVPRSKLTSIPLVRHKNV